MPKIIFSLEYLLFPYIINNIDVKIPYINVDNDVCELKHILYISNIKIDLIKCLYYLILSIK